MRRKEQPSVRRALPPVGWQRTVEQPAQITTVWACEKTVVMVKQPGHLTSMKKERGCGTRVCRREKTDNQPSLFHHCVLVPYPYPYPDVLPFPFAPCRGIRDPGPGRIVQVGLLPQIGSIFHNFGVFFRNSVVSYLKLVLTGLGLRGGVEEIDRENLS